MNGVAKCHELFATYFIATKNVKNAEEEILKMEKNYSSKVYRPIVDGYVSVIRIMKIYGYPVKEIQSRIEKFSKKCRENNREELFKTIMEESL